LNLDSFDEVLDHYSLLIRCAQESENRRNGVSEALQPGDFVWTPDSRLVGKLGQVRGSLATVRFFHSVAHSEEHDYLKKELVRAILPKQTRVYTRGETEEDWQVGRIIGYLGERTYDVRFPNKADRTVAESGLEVRTLARIVDPTEVLGGGGMETQFLHDRRVDLLSSILELRGKSRGLTGLLSSAITLVPHQVEVVRKVLEDPVQRYMLADEVGLGKTIEAGAILRQFLLDNPDGKAIVLVPQVVKQQWESELVDKFYIQDFGDRVEVHTWDSLRLLRKADLAVEFLIIDEAQHLLDSSVQDFQTLRRIAHGTPRLLLLSATPVLGQEEVLFRLLNLLDPVAHPDGRLEAFREKVERREEFVHRLLPLDPTLPRSMIRNDLAELLKAFPRDEHVRSLIESFESDRLPPDFVVSTLKRHVAETYRVHHRLLRNRREDTQVRDFLPQRQTELTEEDDADSRTGRAWSLLEDWRFESRSHLEEDSRRLDLPEETLERQRADLYASWIEALGCGVEVLAGLLEREISTPRFGLFPGEDTLLKEILAALRQDPEVEDDWLLNVPTLRGYRDRALATTNPRDLMVAHSLDSAKTGCIQGLHLRALCFSSSTQRARGIYNFLSGLNVSGSVFGLFAGMDRTEVEGQLEAFQAASEHAVLVVDSSGAEGLNLQFVDVILHLDLPLSAAAMEQRIGRLDRLGRHHRPLRQYVFLPFLDDVERMHSPWHAWFLVLKDHLKIFERSISEFQFVLDDVRARAVLELYRNSGAGITSLAPQISELLRRERTRVDEQYALDGLVVDESDALLVFEELSDVDKNTPLPCVAGAWFGEVLKFFEERGAQAGVHRLAWTKQTLLADIPWRPILDGVLDSGRKRLTYSRRVAQANPGTALLRPGAPLVDVLEHLLLRDDRGTAFGTWRVVPDMKGEWMGFRLCYCLEAGYCRAVQALDWDVELRILPSVRRRAGAFFPPRLETIYLDASLNEVTDPEILGHLHARYSDRPTGGRERDFNLGSRRDALDSLIPPYQFSQLCGEVRTRSEEILRGSKTYREGLARAVDRATKELGLINQRLRYRAAALCAEDPSWDDSELRREIELNEALVAAVKNPDARLDAIGVFVLAPYAPEDSHGH